MQVKKQKILAVGILLMLIFTLSRFSVSAEGEPCGPRMDYLQVTQALSVSGTRVPTIYLGTVGIGGLRGGVKTPLVFEEDFLEDGLIDIVDSPLSAYWIDKWVGEGRVPDEITLSSYCEMGKFEFALNNQKWPTGCDGMEPHCHQLPDPPEGVPPCPEHLGPGADWDPVTETWKVFYDPDCPWCQKAREFRKALAHLADKYFYTSSILEGMGERIDTMVPRSLGWTDYAGLEAEGLIYDYSVTEAEQILDAAGFTLDGEHRINPRAEPGEPTYLESLIFYIPTDDPYLLVASDFFEGEIEDLGIPVTHKYNPEELCYTYVLSDYNYHIFAAGWWSPYSDFDYIHDIYHSKVYWASAFGSPNYPGFCNLEFDEQAEKIKYGTSFEEVYDAVLEAQRIYARNVPVIDLWSLVGVKAYRTGWEGTVNIKLGMGVDNYFTFTNMYKPNESTIKWGFGFNFEYPNVMCAISCERKILSLIYDSLILPGPYIPSEEYGCIAESWSTGTWEQGTKVTFNLRDNVKWHDGTDLTAEDVKFSIEFTRDCGYWAWMGDRVADVDHVEANGDQVIVYFNKTSVWALHWVGFIPIINKKMWMAANDYYGWGYGTDSWKPEDVGLYHPWNADIYNKNTGTVGSDGIIDLKQDGTGPWKYVGKNVDYVSLEANRDFYRTQTEISEYIETAFHRIGNVNYPGSVHQPLYVASGIGTDRSIGEPDITLLGKAYLTTPDDPHGIDWGQWNVDADINDDGTVDDLDIAVASFCYGRSAGGSALPSLLKLPAHDQYNNTLASDVYIDCQLVGNTSSMGFMVQMGTHEVFVNDFWESGTTGYRYAFDHWGDNVTDNARNITILVEETITVHFNKKWCPGDVNGDGIVTIVDVVTISLAIGSQRDIGDPWPPNGDWDSRADLNCDGIVDIVDLNIACSNFGNVYE
jgi:ABC-type transport system substrate-binding protein